MKILKLWNNNFNKGVSLYQICLMSSMIVGAILSSETLILFSMFNVLFGYFESNVGRFVWGEKQ